MHLALLALGRVMAEILIECRVFGVTVPTGITTEMIVLDTLDFDLSMYCPACRQIHKWTRTDAWVDRDDAARAVWH
jgi:hypothetical protein